MASPNSPSGPDPGTNPNEFRCLNCGAPVEDRYWCEVCRVELLPPGDGFVAIR